MNPTLSVVLSPGAAVLRRGADSLQFGLDAGRAGIVEVPHAAGIARALSAASRPVDVDSVLDQLAAAGLSPPAAVGLVEELLVYGVLRPARPASVALVGDSALARHLTSLLTATGVAVRSPFPDEELADALPTYGDKWPLVLVDQMGLTLDDAAAVARFAPTVVSVSLIDARGLVSVLRLDGAGPCPMCVQLHWARNDGHFLRVLAQHGENEVRQDPVAVAATAATAAALVPRLSGGRSAATAGLPPVAAGDCLVVDPYAPDRGHRFRLDAHAGCPVCFEA